MLNDILKTVIFKKHKARGGASKTRGPKKYQAKSFLKIANTEARIGDESNDLQSQEMKIIIPSNIIVIWTGSELLLALKLSGHTDTLK